MTHDENFFMVKIVNYARIEQRKSQEVLYFDLMILIKT